MKSGGLFIVLLLSAVFKISLEYPDGAPEESYSACQTMVPGHGSKPQSGKPLATLSISKTHGLPGEKVIVRLESENKKSFFKGFLIQARSSLHPEKRIGSFEIDSKYGKPMNCNGGLVQGFRDAVTHSSRDQKLFAEAKWTVPEDMTEDEEAVFFYSVVHNFTTYWVKAESKLRFSLRVEGSRNVK